MNVTASLDPHHLMEDARRCSGLSQFGEPDISEPLRRLTDALSSEANLHPAGFQFWRERLHNILVGRLRAENWFGRHPEILEQPIVAPLVILGLTRTGTTLLQRLMASDKRFYFAASWEVYYPVPGDDDVGGGKRIATRTREISEMLAAAPELAAIHPWDALGAEEDILLLDHTLLSTTSETMACIPSYHDWIKTQDLRPAYRYLKKMLQLLQWQKKQRGVAAADRWLLKTPMHLGQVDIIDELFPDADFIQTHRDPIETIPSYASMVYNLWCNSGDGLAPAEAGRQVVETLRRDLYRCMAARDKLDPKRFFDVDFRDTVTDPLALLARIYRHFDLPMTAEARNAIQDYMANNPREKRPPHHYTLAQYGLTPDGIRRELAEYRRRYIETDLRQRADR